MQNTKLQTLWNLCNELKGKREELVEQWRHSQHEIGATQNQLATEFHQLKQNNAQLAQELAHLNDELDKYHQEASTPPEASAFDASGFSALFELEQKYGVLFEKYHQLKTDLLLIKYDILQAEDDAFLRDLGDIEAPLLGQLDQLNQWSQGVFALKESTLQEGLSFESLSPFHQELDDLDMMHMDLASQMEQFQSLWEEAPETESGSSEDIQALQAQLTEKSEAFASLEATHLQIKTEFESIKANNESLFSQCEELAGLTQTLQTEMSGMVALTLSEEGLVESKDNTVSNDDTDTKQALKDATLEKSRKYIVSVLKNRFNKVPRRIHNLLKKVESIQKMDKLFDKALGVETMEVFQNTLEDLVA